MGNQRQNSSGLSQGRGIRQLQDESEEYEVEDVTEQIVFEDDDG